jgi:protein SCO1
MPLRLLLTLALAAALQAAAPLAATPDAPATGEESVAVAPAEPAEERLTDARRQQREDFAGIGVDERLGDTVPTDIRLVDRHGAPVSLGDAFDGERPSVLVFAYHDCPMLCSLVLNAVTKAVRESTLALGPDYRVLVVSIDPADGPEQSSAAHARYAAYFDDPAAAEAYAFLTAEEAEIRRLTDAVGFRYEWVESRQEWAHAAVAIFLSPKGTVTRYLYGLDFPARDFRTAVLEAGEGRIGSPMDQLLLYCFVYDPEAGGYVLHAMNAMRLGGGVTLLLLALALALFWRREKRGNDRARQQGGSSWGHPLDTAPA